MGGRSCRDLEDLLIRRRVFVLPGSGGNLALARPVTLAARCLHEFQSTSNLPAGLGSPHSTGRYLPVDSPVSLTGGRRFSEVEVFLMRWWDRILPECDQNSVLVRGATLAARSVLHHHLTSNPPVVLGLPHRAGRQRPVWSRLSPPRFRSCTDTDWFWFWGCDLIHPVSGANSALARGATLPAR